MFMNIRRWRKIPNYSKSAIVNLLSSFVVSTVDTVDDEPLVYFSGFFILSIQYS